MILKKIATILGGALMIGSTIGMASAAAFPAPFVEGGVANVAVVVGANAALSDGLAATNIGNKLSSTLAAQTAGGGSTTTVGGTAWEVGGSSNQLEVGESIHNVDGDIDSTDLAILTSGEIVNSKGTAQYEQFLYFEDVSSSMVNYTKNDNDDTVGDFFIIESGQVIARYVIDFTTSLKSDITSAGVLDDIEDETIDMLGKTYTITTATNDSDGDVTLVLMSGADKATINSGEEITVGAYTISAVVSSSTAVKFTINGQQIDEMNKGEIEPIYGTNDYIAVTDIDYESFSGGLHQASFWLGADKVELINNSNMKINGETVDAKVQITMSESSGDISISEISINMTADDDIYVPVGGKLSETIATDGDEPEVLVTQNWDIEFKGFESQNEETVSLSASGSDKKYTLKFDNYLGNEVSLPLFYTNNTGIYGGDSADDRLIFFANDSGKNISKNDYFILNTANPMSSTSNAKTFVVRYKGTDSRSDSTPKATFDVLGVEDNKEVSVDSAVGAYAGTRLSLKLGGSTFNFMNTSTAESDNFELALTGSSNSVSGNASSGTSASIYFRTQYNTFINLTDMNYTVESSAMHNAGDWNINISIDDTNRDDNTVILSQQLLYVTYINGTDSDVKTTVIKTPSALWVSDPDNNDRSTYRTTYGAFIEEVDGSDSPAEHVITIPENILRPLVYVSSGEISVTTSTAGVSELGSITVYDNEASAMTGKNLIVVGGSCINSVAADLLGKPACSADFTALTTVGAGEALIQSFDKGGKVALLVAGYNAADTTKATTYLVNNAVDTVVGTKLKVTSTTEASAITA